MPWQRGQVFSRAARMADRINAERFGNSRSASSKDSSALKLTIASLFLAIGRYPKSIRHENWRLSYSMYYFVRPHYVFMLPTRQACAVRFGPRLVGVDLFAHPVAVPTLEWHTRVGTEPS